MKIQVGDKIKLNQAGVDFMNGLMYIKENKTPITLEDEMTVTEINLEKEDVRFRTEHGYNDHVFLNEVASVTPFKKEVTMNDMARVVEVGVILSHTALKNPEIKDLKDLKMGDMGDMDTYFNICCKLVERWKYMEREEVSDEYEFGYITEYYNNEDNLLGALKEIEITDIR